MFCIYLNKTFYKKIIELQCNVIDNLVLLKTNVKLFDNMHNSKLCLFRITFFKCEVTILQQLFKLVQEFNPILCLFII